MPQGVASNYRIALGRVRAPEGAIVRRAAAVGVIYDLRVIDEGREMIVLQVAGLANLLGPRLILAGNVPGIRGCTAAQNYDCGRGQYGQWVFNHNKTP